MTTPNDADFGSSDFEFRFSVRKTRCGATVTMTTPRGRVQTKRFRNGYMSAETSAKQWITERVAALREYEVVDGGRKATIVIE